MANVASSSARSRLSVVTASTRRRVPGASGKPTSLVRCGPDVTVVRQAESSVDRKEYVMFKTVLWATDGSETAALALPYALGLAEPDSAKLVVVHVREIFVGRAGGFPVLADESELRDEIRSQVEKLRDEGLDATFIVR